VHRHPVSWPLLAVVTALLAAPAAATELADFARCLARAGATYYTADWCPHCARQNDMFGNALRHLRVVDCTDGCDDVKSFPTWTFRDGSTHRGVASFATLASRTGCRLGAPDAAPGPEEPEAPERTEGGQRERYMGGAKIIDVR
jgi:hypothetical protein